MNLVESILNQVSGDALGRLSSLVDADGSTTRNAIRAAVPTVLASLSGLAGSKDGANQLASTLGSLDASCSRGLSQMLAGDTGDLVQRGSSLLTSLLGDNTVSGIASAIGRYAGLSAETSKKLIAAVLPTILGIIAGQWKSLGGTPGALASLFSDQKKNIAHALPEGFSLANIPGLADVASALESTSDRLRMVGDRASDTARRGAQAVRQNGQSALAWAAPLAALALVLAGLWYFLNHREKPVVAAKAINEREAAPPDEGPVARTALRPTALDPSNAGTVTNELKSVLTGAVEELSNVRDSASAEFALPKLKLLDARIDTISDTLDKMSETGQIAIGELIGQQAGKLKALASKVLAIPGTEKLRPVIDEITTKLAGLNLAQVAKDASSTFASLTQSLETITDRATAQQALPKLEGLSHRLDELTKIKKSMSSGGQAMLVKMVSGARTQLDDLVSTVLRTLGADVAVVKPVLSEILVKLSGLATSPA